MVKIFMKIPISSILNFASWSANPWTFTFWLFREKKNAKPYVRMSYCHCHNFWITFSDFILWWVLSDPRGQADFGLCGGGCWFSPLVKKLIIITLGSFCSILLKVIYTERGWWWEFSGPGWSCLGYFLVQPPRNSWGVFCALTVSPVSSSLSSLTFLTCRFVFSEYYFMSRHRHDNRNVKFVAGEKLPSGLAYKHFGGKFPCTELLTRVTVCTESLLSTLLVSIFYPLCYVNFSASWVLNWK